MASQWYSIPEWHGIQQQADGTLLPVTSAYDARNMETGDGNLSVAKGYTKYKSVALPGSSALLKLIVSKGAGKIYAVTSLKIYRWDDTNTTWAALKRTGTATDFSFGTDISARQVDVLQTRIGSRDVILVCSGERQITKIYTEPPDDDTCEEFGAGLYSYTGAVSSYDATSMTVTLSSAMNSEAQRRCLAYGITIADYYYDVYQVTDPTHVALSSALLHTPSAGEDVTIRGGGSDAQVAYAELYSNRLFAAGDPSAPYRLYWSSVPGGGRTVEDWLSVDGSADASGGYVEVGDGAADNIIGLTALSNQLIIWKRYSVWRLLGDRPSTYTLERIDDESDLISNSGVVVKYDTPYMLMPNGISTYNGVSVVPVDGGIKYLRRFFEQNKPDVSNSRSAFWNNRLYMTCRANPNSTYEDTIIVYDITRNSYMIRDGFQIADITAVGSEIYVLTQNRYMCKFEDGTDYDGTPISAYWYTQPIDFGKKMNRHQAQAIYSHITGDTVKVTVYGDYLDHAKNVTPLTARAGYTTVRFQTDQQYFIQFKFENISGGAFTLNGGVNIYVLSELKL